MSHDRHKFMLNDGLSGFFPIKIIVSSVAVRPILEICYARIQ